MKKLVIGLLAGVLVVGGATVGVTTYVNHNRSKAQQDVITMGKFENMPEPVVLEELEEMQESKMFTLNILSQIHWPSVDEPAEVGIYNGPEDNYDMRVELIDNESGKTLYQTPVLLYDQKIEKAYLTNKDVEPGTYTCTAYFYGYNKGETELATTQTISNIQVTIGE